MATSSLADLRLAFFGSSAAELAALQAAVTAGENFSRMVNPASCRTFRTATQSIPNVTKTAVLFNAGNRWDTDTMHDYAGANPSRIVFKTAGLYEIGGIIAFDANATGFRYAIIKASTAAGEIAGNSQLAVPATDWTIVNVSTQFRFAVNDYIELLAYQTSGGALNIQPTGSSAIPEFWATRIGP